MDIKETQIIYDEQKNMYKIDLGFYTRFFEYLIFSNNGIIRKFGKINIIDNDFNINGNYIFGFTNFFGGTIINIFSLNNFEDIYKIVKDVKIYSFQVKNINYYLIVFLDLEGNMGFYTDFSDNNFEIIIQNMEFTIKNKVFQSIIYKNKIIFEKNSYSFKFIKEKENELLLGIADLYYFKNLFSPVKDIDFLKDLEFFCNKIFSFGNSKIKFKKLNNFDVGEIKIYFLGDIKDLKELQRLFLSFPFYQFLMYLSENKELREIFAEFEDISKLDIKELNFDFELPKNIFEYDKNFLEFQKTIFKLQYLLYSLKTLYTQINIQNTLNNSYQEVANIRLGITKESLEKNIIKYENIYNLLIGKLNLI